MVLPQRSTEHVGFLSSVRKILHMLLGALKPMYSFSEKDKY